MPLTESAPDALAHVYAQSLFELAQQAGGQNAIEETMGELEEIFQLAKTDGTFSEFLATRILPVESRAASIERIFKNRISDLTLRFMLILNEKGRLSHLPSIIAAFDQLVQEHFGRIEIDVFTAAPLAPDELRLIEDRLQAKLGKKPVTYAYTDSSMIGGLKLKIGDQLIDASVASHLRKMRDRLASEGLPKVRAESARIIDG